MHNIHLKKNKKTKQNKTKNKQTHKQTKTITKKMFCLLYIHHGLSRSAIKYQHLHN